MEQPLAKTEASPREDSAALQDVSREKPDSRVTVVDRGRTIVMHRVQESELRDLGSAQVTLNTNLAFFTLMVGLFAAFASVLLTSHQVLSDRMLMVFSGLMFLSLALGAFFGINALRDRGKVRENIERLINDSERVGE
jgi:hypothetical protein